MHRNKQIAIILPDTLQSIGLQSMLTDYFPPVEISTTLRSSIFDFRQRYVRLLLYKCRFICPLCRLFPSPPEQDDGPDRRNRRRRGTIATSHITIKASQEVIIEQLEQLFTGENNSISSDNNKELSTRETDVLQLIVKGSTNKEIADKLNISLNTVLSHRKNITTKLGIKTVSGLTFYAIMNGIISGDDIEL